MIDVDLREEPGTCGLEDDLRFYGRRPLNQ